MYCAEVLNIESAPAASPTPQRRLTSTTSHAESSRMISVFTLVIWMSCVLIGALGFALSYSRPKPPVAPPVPVQATFLNVELSNDPLPNEQPPATLPVTLPPPANAVAQPQTAQSVLVAEPTAAIAFAVPIAAAANTTDAARASYSASTPTESVSTLPAVQSLTFGRGEGKQPAPDYPLVAKRQGQQGAVKVKFVVGSDGRVLSAETSAASPWPMLNDSAIRTIRQRWKFAAGSVRVFEVLIHFQLNS